MSEEILYSFIVRDVSVTMSNASIKEDLMNRYDGVSEVTRMFYEKRDEHMDPNPKTSVQVDFTLPNDAEKIRRDGNIVIGGICRRAYAIRRPQYLRSFKNSRSNERKTTKQLSEQDLINMFKEQKRLVFSFIIKFL